MSSKILNASSWDDLKTGQEISDISLQQGLITRRLLSESMQDRAEACSDVTMAALVSVILFDVRNDAHCKDHDKLTLQC